ncbi:hypothetical protein BDW71DRAFT_144151 [Aspergillus fruticulosus]
MIAPFLQVSTLSCLRCWANIEAEQDGVSGGHFYRHNAASNQLLLDNKHNDIKLGPFHSCATLLVESVLPIPSALEIGASHIVLHPTSRLSQARSVTDLEHGLSWCSRAVQTNVETLSI